MAYEIDEKSIVSGGMEILKQKLNRLERVLIDGEGVIQVLDAAFDYKNTRKFLDPYVKKYVSGIDSKYNELISKFSKVCEEIE